MGLRGSTLSITSVLDGGGWPKPRPGHFTPGKDPVLGGPQGRSGRGWKISPPTGIRSLDRPARSESLYRLSYPGPSFIFVGTFIFNIVNTVWLFLF